MQIDMHFYALYALARAAGIRDKTAAIIAHASQFVDDSLEDDEVVTKNHKVVIPIMTSHRPLNFKNAQGGDPLPELHPRSAVARV